MAFKTLLTVVSDVERGHALEQAISLTRALDAHLEVICLGVDRVQSSYYEIGVSAALLQASLEQAHEKGRALQTDVEARLHRSGLRTNTTIGVVTTPDAGHHVARAARFCDLAVTCLPYDDDGQPGDVAVLEELLFDAGCPTLCVPRNKTVSLPETVVIGWNYSAQALRTARAALPLVKYASNVHIAVVDPPVHGPERANPGEQLAVLLSRHGVTCEVNVLPAEDGGVCGALNRFATERGADLLVMGAYGHSRFREALLGGTTRHMLQYAKVPVFMTH